MKNNNDKSREKGYARMHRKHSIIESAWACNHNALVSAIGEDPHCINDQDENGLTAAHISVGLSNYAYLSRICSSPEFDPFITDSFNRRAIDCITRPGMENFRKLLLHKMYGVFPEMATNRLTP